MTTGAPGKLTDLVVTAARLAGVRLVLQSGAAGLGQTASAADHLQANGDVLVIGDVPHQWLFPLMAAVVHHGGAGTTGAALRAGVPAVIVPKIGDQPFWAARVAAIGAAPPALPFRRLTAPALAAAIRTATGDGSYRQRASQVAWLAREDGYAPVAALIGRLSRLTG